jgi:hypothetical protein
MNLAMRATDVPSVMGLPVLVMYLSHILPTVACMRSRAAQSRPPPLVSLHMCARGGSAGHITRHLVVHGHHPAGFHRPRSSPA